MPDFDFSDLARLSADLGKVPPNAGKNVRQAVEVSARKVKDSWRGKLEGSPTLPGAARAIAYNLKGGEAIRGSTISAEIEPRQGGQGSLVFVDEFGSLFTAPRGSGRAALEENADDFEKGLNKAIEDAEREAGL